MLIATSCGGDNAASVSPASRFLSAVAGLCGKAFAGRVVANEPAAPNDPFVGQALVMHVRTCDAPDTVQVPFHVGEDHSRTWVLTLVNDRRRDTNDRLRANSARLRLKHDHRHQDGTDDAVTMYGGDSTTAGTAERQEFPVDDFSKEMFTREKRAVSNINVWAMEIQPGRMFAYELTRPGRKFRVEFDLTKTVPTPPAPWGG